MRKLTYLVLALAALYSGYWFIGASALAKGIDAQIAAMQAEGWTIETTDLATRGFPSRFDTSAADITIGTPSNGLVWRAPFAQANALSYRPNEIIVVFPNHQEVEINGQPYDISSDNLKARAAVSANTDLDLANVTVETGPLSVDVATGTLISISNGIAALRPSGPAPFTYDVYADLDELTLPENLRRLLDPNGNLPVTFSQATVDGKITLDRALDRNALPEGAGPALNGFTLNGMTFSWGNVQLLGRGDVTIDSAGVPTGTITLQAQNWSQLLDMAVKIGAVDAGVLRTLKNMATLMSGGSTDISVPISFQKGLMSIGPIPVGPAPRFR